MHSAPRHFPVVLLSLLGVLFGLGACGRHPWLPVLDGMKASLVTTELAASDPAMTKRAPAGFAVAKDDKWVLFYFDPGKAPDVQAAFARLAADCFSAELPGEEPTDPARHAAVCAFERVPPPPQGESVAGTS